MSSAHSTAFTFQYGYIYYKPVWNVFRPLHRIYIPIWLYLLWFKFYKPSFDFTNLHSNMVIFIIWTASYPCPWTSLFTFQYGYIYYLDKPCCLFPFPLIYIPIWLYLLCRRYYRKSSILSYLHSNMVIFIIKTKLRKWLEKLQFTFQYGYIYYLCSQTNSLLLSLIYIPIWLYLLFILLFAFPLYSTSFTFQYGYIYYQK